MDPPYKAEKLAQILKTHEWSDCVFIVEAEKIPAHKLILACNSPVFELMLYGEMSSSEIEIADSTTEDFKTMLQYIYTEDVEIKSVQQAWNLIYLSEKYFLMSLMNRCIAYVKKHLSVSTLALSYEYSTLYGLEELESQCWDDLCTFFKETFLLSSYHVKPSTLRSILSLHEDRDEFLVMAAVNWAITECSETDQEVTPENIWNVFDDNDLILVVQWFGFTPISEFGTVDASQLKRLQLVSNLSDEVYRTYVKNGKNPDEKSRRHIPPKPVVLRPFYKIVNNLRFGVAGSVANNIQVNRDSYLSAVMVSTLHRPRTACSDVYKGEITVKIEGGNYPEHVEVNSGVFGYDRNFTVNLSQFVFLKAAESYRITVGYRTESNGEILLCAYNSKVESNNSVAWFSDFDGSVIAGLCFYPS